MQHRVQTLASLTCHIIDKLPAGVRPRLGVVLCHGYGAPATDLLALADALMQVEPVLAACTQFLFPEAPHTLDDMGMPTGRAWWPLSLQRLQAQLSARRFDEIRQACPEGLPEARDALLAMVAEWTDQVGLTVADTVVGGFSQGAMLSVEVAAALPTSPAGVIAFSGELIHESAWRSGLAHKPDLPVFQSHGQYDVVLPYVAGTWLKQLLEESSARL